jgi:hypothetical protein
MKSSKKDTGKRTKLKVRKQTVKDLTAPVDAQKVARGGRVGDESNASFCGMNTPTYSANKTCKCAGTVY